MVPPQGWSARRPPRFRLPKYEEARTKNPQSSQAKKPSYAPPIQNSGLTSIPHHDSSSVTWAGRGNRLLATFSLSYIILHNVPEGQLAGCRQHQGLASLGSKNFPISQASSFPYTEWSLLVRTTWLPFFAIILALVWSHVFLFFYAFDSCFIPDVHTWLFKYFLLFLKCFYYFWGIINIIYMYICMFHTHKKKHLKWRIMVVQMRKTTIKPGSWINLNDSLLMWCNWRYRAPTLTHSRLKNKTRTLIEPLNELPVYRKMGHRCMCQTTPGRYSQQIQNGELLIGQIPKFSRK